MFVVSFLGLILCPPPGQNFHIPSVRVGEVRENPLSGPRSFGIQATSAKEQALLGDPGFRG